MIKSKKEKFENDDYSRMAGKDFKEESFEIGNEKSHHHEQGEKPFDTKSKKPACKGAEEATRRDLGVDDI